MSRSVSEARSAVADRVLLRDMGTALDFNGVDSIAVRNAQTAYNLINFSISFWVRAHPQTVFSAIYAEGSSAANSQIFAIRSDPIIGNRLLTYFVRDNSNVIQTETYSNKPVFDGAIHHVTVSDATGNVNIYIDGMLDKSFSYTRGTLTLDRTSLGALQRATPAIFSKAILDELRVFNIALTAQQVSNLYYRAIVPSGLVLEWLLNTGSGTTAIDTSGNSANGTITSPSWVSNNFLISRPVAAGRIIVT
jgi:hypothetical protein